VFVLQVPITIEKKKGKRKTSTTGLALWYGFTVCWFIATLNALTNVTSRFEVKSVGFVWLEEWIWDDGFEGIWVNCVWMRRLFGLMDGW